MAPIISGTNAWTGDDLKSFDTQGQVAGASANSMPYTLIDAASDNQGNDAYARAPFGGYFQGLIVYVDENDHVLGDNEIAFYKITALSNYTVKTQITSLAISIGALQKGYFWSNPFTARGSRFFRANDAIGVELRKLTGATPTGVTGVTVTGVYDFEKGI